MSKQTAAGFTLIEIMVALTVGGIALGSIYAIGAASTRYFRNQQRVSSAQTSLRSAMETLKRDFQRAGFMSSPNTRVEGESCVEPGFAQDRWIGAVNGYEKSVARPAKLDPAGRNDAAWYSVDDVWLTGNYSTSGEYAGISLSADRKTVTVPMDWHSFHRDFSDWDAAGSCNEAAFKLAFAPSRTVRLHGMNGTFFYTQVESAECTGTGAATVVLKETVPGVCSMEGGWISPVNTMRYHVDDAKADEDDVMGRVTVLRRTEVLPDRRTERMEAAVGAQQVGVDDRAVLDYVVRFKVDFLMWLADKGRISQVPMTTLEWRDQPHSVRGVILDVAVRTSQHDPNFGRQDPALPRLTPNAAFVVDQSLGAARVRRMKAELLLPNLANRNR